MWTVKDWIPPTCKRCHDAPVAANGFCSSCNPHPVRRNLIHDGSLPLGESYLIQTSEKLDDGRTRMVLNVYANRETEHGQP